MKVRYRVKGEVTSYSPAECVELRGGDFVRLADEEVAALPTMRGDVLDLTPFPVVVLRGEWSPQTKVEDFLKRNPDFRGAFVAYDCVVLSPEVRRGERVSGKPKPRLTGRYDARCEVNVSYGFNCKRSRTEHSFRLADGSGWTGWAFRGRPGKDPELFVEEPAWSDLPKVSRWVRELDTRLPNLSEILSDPSHHSRGFALSEGEEIVRHLVPSDGEAYVRGRAWLLWAAPLAATPPVLSPERAAEKEALRLSTAERWLGLAEASFSELKPGLARKWLNELEKWDTTGFEDVEARASALRRRLSQ